MHEQETKYRLPPGDYERLKNRLGPAASERRLIDRYWDLFPRALRLRSWDTGAAVTVKGPKLPGPDGITVREEWERPVEVSQLPFFEALFQQLGLVPLAVIAKHRLTYETPDLILALDRVDRLGDFFEIELKPTGTLKDLQKKAQELGLGTIETKSYLELWLAGPFPAP